MLHRSIANATGLVAGFKSLVVGQFSSTPCSQHLQVLRWSWFCCCCCFTGRKFAFLAAKFSRTYSISLCQCLLQLPGSPASAPTPTSTCRYDSSLGKVRRIYCGLHCICGEHVWCNKIAWRRPLSATDYTFVSISGLLTKKFVNLIKQAEDGVLDLNKAADTLHVGT
jgi:hypothetical protein